MTCCARNGLRQNRGKSSMIEMRRKQLSGRRKAARSYSIAAATGHKPSEAFMTAWEETFSQQKSQYSTSMLRDIERDSQTEVEHILGFMLNKAREPHTAHQTLLLAYTHIKACEQRKAAGRLP